MSRMLCAVVIPSLRPDNRLEPYVRGLCQSGFHIIVVDDGSGEPHRSLFDAVEKIENVSLLRHSVNQGKGAALKTAYRYLSEHRQDIECIITADADGQHTLADVIKLRNEFENKTDGLILGTRDFTLAHVPWKSRLGNRITTFIFRLLYGVKCPDTQTGLRGFGSGLLPTMLSIEGARFEYEMNVLIHLARAKISLHRVGIQTVYEDDNVGSHFHPIRDSIRIYKVILGNFIKFLFSSLLGTGIDVAIYFVLFDVFENIGFEPVAIRIMTAKGIARIISAMANYAFNKRFVFQLRQKRRHVATKYALLCVAILAISAGSVAFLKVVLNINERLSSPIIDFALFFLSYRLQRNWVFIEEGGQMDEK